MSDTVIIGISGKKQSGKSTLCEFLEENWIDQKRLLKGNGTSTYLKVYSFADELKKTICIDLLGVPEHQILGSDEDKNQLTRYEWDNLPREIRKKYSNEMREETVAMERDPETGEEIEYTAIVDTPRSGFMTARELMQVVGTDIFRKMFADDIWVRATLNKIRREKPAIAIISDVRFKSEVRALLEPDDEQNESYLVRLHRKPFEDSHDSEVDLDDYDFSVHGDLCLMVDNTSLTMEEKNLQVVKWLEDKLN